MIATPKERQELTSIFTQLSFGSELKDYRMYLAIFLFDEYEKDVSAKALKEAEPLVIYNNSLYKVIDFVFQNKSTIVIEEGQNQITFQLLEKNHSQVVTYRPDCYSDELAEMKRTHNEVFHKILVFHYQQIHQLNQ
jgi:hypothetical protein